MNFKVPKTAVCWGRETPSPWTSPARNCLLLSLSVLHETFWYHQSLSPLSSLDQPKEVWVRRAGSCLQLGGSSRGGGRLRGGRAGGSTPGAGREGAGGDRLASLSSSQMRRARSSWWATGRGMAKGVRRVKSSQLPFSIRFCFASSEFRHLHNTLSFKNNVGVPDIEFCKQVCSQLREELLLPPSLDTSAWLGRAGL